LASYVKKESLNYKWYGICFFVCEVLNLVNVIIQCLLLDSIMHNEFRTYGYEVIMFLFTDSEDRTDPMDQMFPKVTKCNIKEYGKTGSPENHDGMCSLNHNVINEIIFVVIYFYLCLLGLITLGFLIMKFYAICFLIDRPNSITSKVQLH
jgi:hypothetical protein